MKYRILLVTTMIVSMLAAGLSFAAESDKKAAPSKAPEKAAPAKATEKAAALPDPVAKVNGIGIPASELKKAAKALQQNQQIPADKTREFQLYVLNQLIAGELMYQVSQKTPINDLDKKVNDQLTKLKERFKDNAEFEKGLKEQGLTVKELKELIRRNAVIDNHIEKVIIPTVKVTDADLKEFYDKNPASFTMPERVRASHILITVDPKATADEKKKARETAEDLLKQLKGGADFAKLAQEKSGCPSNKQGGDLGYFGKGQMVKPFEDAAYALKPGELSAVVETQFGYHIIKLTEKKGPEMVPLADVKTRLEADLKKKKISEAVNATLEDAKKKGKIELLIK
jgi:peptidyl-prolyl cis-trans isomerase C